MVPPDDVAGLAGGISRLLRDRTLTDSLRAQGPVRARQFGRESVLQRWESVLSEAG
jgi:glycosyltransferase involved in cell wall biosynthesis